MAEIESKTFFDKRLRKWEIFVDVSYYHMTCVRLKDDKSFNSLTSFHFSTYKKGEEFAELIKEST